MKNKELGRLVLKQVTEFPETFDMSTWGRETACGTTACLAGWVLHFSGYRLHALPGDPYSTWRDADNHPCRVPHVARMLLGLSDEEYWVDGGLFYLGNEQAVARFRELTEADDD